MEKSILLVLLFFSYSCFSQEKTFINCNYTIDIRFEKISSKDSILLTISFQNTSDKSIFLSEKIKTRWTLPKDYLDISLGDNFSNESPNYSYTLFHLPKGKIKKHQVIIEKSRADFFYVHLRGSYFLLNTRVTKKQISYGDLPKKSKRLIYYDFDENFYEYEKGQAQL